MDTFMRIIEVVELGALIALVIYLIRLTRDNNELHNKLNKSELLDRNLDELNEFNNAMVADPDIARIWQDGCADYRLNDIDRSRFSLMATQYLSILTNQKQRADSIEDWAQAEAATGRLVEALMMNPGLVASWETLAGKIASPELRGAVNQILSPPEIEEEIDTATPVEAAEVAVKAAEEAVPAAAEEVATEEASEPDQAAPVETEKAEIAAAKVTAEAVDSSAVETVGESSEVTEPESTESAPDSESSSAEETVEEETKAKGESGVAAPETETESDAKESDVAVAKPA